MINDTLVMLLSFYIRYENAINENFFKSRST